MLSAAQKRLVPSSHLGEGEGEGEGSLRAARKRLVPSSHRALLPMLTEKVLPEGGVRMWGRVSTWARARRRAIRDW